MDAVRTERQNVSTTSWATPGARQRCGQSSSSHLREADYLAQGRAYGRCSVSVNGNVAIRLTKQLFCWTWLQMTLLHQGKKCWEASPKFRLWATWEPYFSVSQDKDWGRRKHLAKWTNGFREKGALLCGVRKKLPTAGFNLRWKKSYSISLNIALMSNCMEFGIIFFKQNYCYFK